MLVVTIVGILSERLVIWPLRRPTTLMITLVSIGLAICSRSLVMLVLGKQPVGYPGFSQTAMLTWGGVSIQTQTLWIVGLTAAFLRRHPSVFRAQHHGQGAAGGGGRSRGGGYRRRAGRDHGAAVVCDRRLCRRTGRRHHHAADAVVLRSGRQFGFKGFSAAMLGGIGSLPGAVVGGLALGLLEAFGSFYISSNFKDAIAFAVLLLILFARPAGLLGRADVVKV